MSSMFNGCTSLTEIPLLDASSVSDISGMFNGCNSAVLINGLTNLGKEDFEKDIIWAFYDITNKISLQNIINTAWDRKSNGQKDVTLVFNSKIYLGVEYSKIAKNKGWIIEYVYV